MKIIYLPGNSIKNKPEADSIKNFLISRGYTNLFFQEWNKWSDLNSTITWAQESQKTKLQIQDEEFILVSKSIGNYVGTLLLKDQKFLSQCKGWLMFGIPLNDLSLDVKEEIELVLKNLHCPTLSILNSKDEHCSLEEFNSFLSSFSEIKTEIIEAEGHFYDYPEKVLEFIENLNPS